MRDLVFDFETRSAAPLKKCGAAAYAQHPSTEVICLALKWHGSDPVIWFGPNFRFPDCAEWSSLPLISDEEMLSMVKSADQIHAYNCQFEYFIWKSVMSRYGFPPLDRDKLRCDAAKAAMFGLPRDLAGACAAAGVPQQKDMEGSRLMMRLCKPRRPRKDEMLADPDWEKKLYWYGSPEEFAREGRYCMQDVRAEEALSDALPDLPEREQKLWQLDLAINDRGIRIDRPAVEAILGCVEKHSATLESEFKRMTNLSSPRQRDATLRLLVGLGVEMDGLTAKDVEAALASTENETAKRILQIRKSLSKSSTAKYQAFLDAAGPDDRVRGSLMYHGAGTGRWTGRLIQPQNFPRGTFSDVEPCIDFFRRGDLESIEMLYGDPMVAASTCIRGMIVPAEGHDFVCADYSSIEGRVLAWLAGEETALEVYRSGRDPYKVAASAIYHVLYEEVTKDQRQRGKVAELACIAEGELVLTMLGLIPIECVPREIPVWDGETWVKHDGVVYRGTKEVITYEGLTATPDHLVFVEGQNRAVHFAEAAASGAHLVQTGDGRTAIRLGSDYFSGEEMAFSKVELLLRSDGVRGMRSGVVGVSERSSDRKVEGVPAVLPASADPQMVVQPSDGGEAALRESAGSGVSELRSAGNPVSVRLRAGGRPVDAGESRCSATGDGNRPGEQRGALRAGQSSLGDTSPTGGEPPCVGSHRGGTEDAVATFHQSRAAAEKEGSDERADLSVRMGLGGGTPEELAPHTRKVRVYDIVNAGPHHRFTVSGKLVHNCGYQGSVGAFQTMAANYGVTLPESEVREIVAKWRDSRPMTTRYWRELEKACAAAVEDPGAVYSYRTVKFMVRNGFLALRLPSGRCLWYANPRLEDKMMSWGETKTVIAFDGVNATTRKWGTQYLYGGLLAENVTQATARDLLVSGMFAAEAAGYRIVFHVHDEMVAEVPEGFGSVEEFEKLMCALPDWATGLPIKAEGYRAKRYRK